MEFTEGRVSVAKLVDVFFNERGLDAAGLGVLLPRERPRSGVSGYARSACRRRTSCLLRQESTAPASAIRHPKNCLWWTFAPGRPRSPANHPPIRRGRQLSATSRRPRHPEAVVWFRMMPPNRQRLLWPRSGRSSSATMVDGMRPYSSRSCRPTFGRRADAQRLNSAALLVVR